MKQLLLAILFLWAATLLIPGLRERTQPATSAVRGWVWDRVEGPTTPVRDRYRRAQARSHLDKMARALVIHRNQGGLAPEQDQLRRFMARNQIVDDGLDPWGTPYLLVQEPDSLAVVSAGPDLTYFTELDLVIRVRYPRRNPAQRPRR